MNLLRGDIWYADLEPTTGSEIGKKRPCVIFSSNIVNRTRRTVVVVPLSTSPKSIPPISIPVISGGRDAVAVIDQIRAIAKERIGNRIGFMSAEDMAMIEKAVRRVLGMAQV